MEDYVVLSLLDSVIAECRRDPSASRDDVLWALSQQFHYPYAVEGGLSGLSNELVAAIDPFTRIHQLEALMPKADAYKAKFCGGAPAASGTH